jgi:hypothetical protein
MPDVCSQGESGVQPPAEPMAKRTGGAAAFVSAGRCVEDFGTACTLNSDCAPGEFCSGGTCHRDQGVSRRRPPTAPPGRSAKWG